MHIMSMTRIEIQLLILATCVGLGKPALASERMFHPPGPIAIWNSEETIEFEQFRGGIVVVDFFAHWCVPCLAASKSLEEEVQRQYKERNGNPAGLPVHVMSVNIESNAPARTRRFVTTTGASLVVNDFEGKLLQQLGGTGIPFLVVLDGTGEGWRVIHSSTGYQGAANLRTVIDSIGADAPDDVLRDQSRWAGLPIEQSVVADFEGQFASDIDLTEAALSHRFERGDFQLTTTLGHASIGLDYHADNDGPAPTDVLGINRRLSENRWSGGVTARWQLRDEVALLGSIGGYDGFTDYRSLWLSEYYRQQFDFHPDYRAPDPAGVNASVGTRWEIRPATSFLQLDVSYMRDRVAPGYELEFIPAPTPRTELIHGREDLDTVAGRAAFESVITPNLRGLAALRIASTTDRDPRFSIESALNWAMSDQLVWRNQIAASIERPDFESWSIATILEHDWEDRWFVSAFARYYGDTGYIENSLLISDATPELDSFHYGVGFRGRFPRGEFRLTAGPYHTRYGPTGDGTAPFRHLYSDRNWLSVQCSLTTRF